MARKRMIDPEFWSDEEIGLWSHSARLLYIGLWNFADDEGRFKAHNQLLKSQIFPYDEHIDMEALKKEISKKIQWYECDGLQYGFIINFLKHQKIDHPYPSKLPNPSQFVTHSGNVQELSAPNIREVNIREVNLSKDIYVDWEKSTLTLWNSFVENYPILSKIQEISDKRRSKLKKRYEKESFRDFAKILEGIKTSPFLLGENDRSWRVTFDWIIDNDTNYLKILEGRYMDKKQSSAEDIRERLGLRKDKRA